MKSNNERGTQELKLTSDDWVWACFWWGICVTLLFAAVSWLIPAFRRPECGQVWWAISVAPMATCLLILFVRGVYRTFLDLGQGACSVDVSRSDAANAKVNGARHEKKRGYQERYRRACPGAGCRPPVDQRGMDKAANDSSKESEAAEQRELRTMTPRELARGIECDKQRPAVEHYEGREGQFFGFKRVRRQLPGKRIGRRR